MDQPPEGCQRPTPYDGDQESARALCRQNATCYLSPGLNVDSGWARNQCEAS